MRMRTNTPAVDTRPKFFTLLSFHRIKYVKNFGLGTRLNPAVRVMSLHCMVSFLDTKIMEFSRFLHLPH